MVDENIAILGQSVTPGHEVVTLDGQPLLLATKQYLMFNKPSGYITSRVAQGNSPTIYDLLPDQYHHLEYIGRLDKESTGLLVLTNDGELAHHMSHPKFEKSKCYYVTLDHPLQPQDRKHLTEGVELDDGLSKLQLEPHDAGWLVTLREGRNRQIRRSFSALGYEVKTLHRIRFGKLELGDLAQGSYRELALGDLQ